MIATSKSGEGSSARDRILAAAFQLIAAEGVAAVTNRRVATAASVSLGSLTYHFLTQQDLLREALERHIGAEIARLESLALSLRRRHLGVADLGMEIERFAASSAARPELLAEFELHLYAARDPRLAEISQRCFEAYEDFAAAALEALGIPEPKRHAPHVVGLMMGTGLKQLAAHERGGAGLADALHTIARGATARAEKFEEAPK